VTANLGGRWGEDFLKFQEDTIDQINIKRMQRTRGVVQAVERLLCKREALSTNTSPAKEKK
jgi:hypothetical protein